MRDLSAHPDWVGPLNAYYHMFTDQHLTDDQIAQASELRKSKSISDLDLAELLIENPPLERKHPMNEMTNPTTVSKVNVYCTGGAALNLGPKVSLGEDMNLFYADTSDANRTEGLEQHLVYSIPLPPPEPTATNGITRKVHRGAGQDRKRIYKACAPHIPKILTQFPAADFNIVVFSASGGSGSVLGPLLVKALQEEGQTVVVIIIGDTSSAKYLENTINTLKSLESIAVANNMPVVMHYHQNQAGVPQSTIDEGVLWGIETLAVLASQDNHGFDTQDVHNWINYNAITPVQAQLSGLSIFDNRPAAAQMLEPISTLSLYDEIDKANPFGKPYYTKTASPRHPREDMPDQLHFVISHMVVDDIFKGLTTAQTEMNRTLAGYRSRSPIVDVDDNLNEGGLVF